MLVCDTPHLLVPSAIAIILSPFSLRNSWPMSETNSKPVSVQASIRISALLWLLVIGEVAEDSRFRSVCDGVNRWLNCHSLSVFFQLGCLFIRVGSFVRHRFRWRGWQGFGRFILLVCVRLYCSMRAGQIVKVCGIM